MGTDLELLQRAARASGIDGAPYELYPGQWWIEIRATEPNDPPTLWNPLEDDGDALRLAVKLKLDVLSGVGCIEVCHCPGTLDDPFGETLAVEYGEDLFDATRRAIVRAAAAMPEGEQG